MGSMNSLHKFFSKIPGISSSLSPSLRLNNEFIWTPAYDIAFQQLKWLIKNIVELKRYDKHREKRIACDANHDGLGAVLEQYGLNGWHPFSFASRYPNPAEKKKFDKRTLITHI